MKHIGPNSIRCHTARAAPWLSAAALLGLWATMNWQARAEQAIAPDPARIAAAMEATPYRIGRWVGREVPMLEAPAGLLRPGAVLSRRYTHLDSGARLDLAVVFATDVRDLHGHVPSVCYPSHGWRVMPGHGDERSGGAGPRAHGEPVSVGLRDDRVRARLYRFAPPAGRTPAGSITVVSLFVLPGGQMSGDLNDLRRSVRWVAGPSMRRGAAHMQVLAAGDVASEGVVEAAGELLDGLDEVFAALGVHGDV